MGKQSESEGHKDCAFCDKSKFRERLVYENKNWYVVATLGQITNGGYLLLIPKEHIPCLGAFTERHAGVRIDSLLRMTKMARRALALKYQHGAKGLPEPVTMFEHGIVGQTVQHAHLHLLPIIIDVTQKIRADFPKAEFQELKHEAHLQELYQRRREPYLFWTVPDGKSMVCWNPPAPAQYMRLIMAELMGRPERGNWRDMNPELDKRLWQDTVRRLKRHFQKSGR